MKQLLLIFIFTLTFPLMAMSEDETAIIDSPDFITEALIKALVNIDAQSFEQRSAFLYQKMSPYIDFNYITRWSAGKSYRYMSQQQKADLQAKLQQFILTTISERFSGYQQTDLQFLPPKAGQDSQAGIGVLLKEPDGQYSTVMFRFYPSETSWKIFDISIKGNSLLRYYRQYFDKVMR